MTVREARHHDEMIQEARDATRNMCGYLDRFSVTYRDAIKRMMELEAARDLYRERQIPAELVAHAKNRLREAADKLKVAKEQQAGSRSRFNRAFDNMAEAL